MVVLRYFVAVRLAQTPRAWARHVLEAQREWPSPVDQSWLSISRGESVEMCISTRPQYEDALTQHSHEIASGNVLRIQRASYKALYNGRSPRIKRWEYVSTEEVANYRSPQWENLRKE